MPKCISSVTICCFFCLNILRCCLHFQAGVILPSPAVASTSSSFTDRLKRHPARRVFFSTWNIFHQGWPANTAFWFWIHLRCTSGLITAQPSAWLIKASQIEDSTKEEKFCFPACLLFIHLCNHGGCRLWLLSRGHLLLHVHRLLAVLFQQEDLLLRHAFGYGGD